MINGQVVTTNPLQIPSLFGADYATTSHLAFILFSLMFVLAVLHENILGMSGEASYTNLFVRVLLVVSLLVFYEEFFRWIVYSLDLLADSIFSRSQYEDTLKAVFKAIEEEKDTGFLGWRFVIKGMNSVTQHIALALLWVLRLLRFVLLSILYIFGPLAVAASVFSPAAKAVFFWLKSLVEVSLWRVLLSILLKVISTMNLTAIYYTENVNNVAVFAANILFIVLLILVPLISKQIVSGGTVGGSGSIALGVVAHTLSKLLPKRGHR